MWRAVPIENIKEFRKGTDARYYRAQFQLAQDYEDKWLTIVYVLDGGYKTLHLIAATREESFKSTPNPYCDTIQKRALPNATKKCVRKPASFERYSRSIPMTPPKSRATNNLSVISKIISIFNVCLFRNLFYCAKQFIRRTYLNYLSYTITGRDTWSVYPEKRYR